MSRSRLLVAVSSPWASEKLAEPICDLARRLDGDVVVAHVTQEQQEDEDESDARQRGEETLHLLTSTLQKSDVRAEGVLLFSNDVAKAILSTAKARNCTLIVLGLSRKGMLRRLIGGDVPGNLIRQSELPVLLYPAQCVGTI